MIVSKYQKVRGMSFIHKLTNTTCEGCLHGKQKKISFTSKEYYSTKPLQLMHIELCPYKDNVY